MVEENVEEKRVLTRDVTKMRRIRRIAALIICVALVVVIFVRARGRESPAGKQDGATLARAVPVTAAALPAATQHGAKKEPQEIRK